MKLMLYLLLITCFNLTGPLIFTASIVWNKMATSPIYENTKLVTENANPFQSRSFRNENTRTTIEILCSKFCASNGQCLSFNLYSTSDNYVCEFLSENFCSNRTRVALQVWLGGIVWDKWLPGMNGSCVDQQLQNKTSSNTCEIGRSGCKSLTSTNSKLSDCNTCVQTCADCATFYGITTRYAYNCTLWPEGSDHSPIFAFCFASDVVIAKRQINLSNRLIQSNYRMDLNDMYRIARLNAYNRLGFAFVSSSTNYVVNYVNFSIDAYGTLMNMVYVTSSGGDGFNLKGGALKPSPWVETDSKCGSFWLLNTTQTSATLQCPGGDISIFGHVNLNVSPAQTGIHWPAATAANEILHYGEIKMKP